MLAWFLRGVVALISIVDWDLGDGFAVGIFVSTDVVFTVSENLGDGEKREKQDEPDSSLRHGEADWLNPQESVCDYIGK